MEILIDGRSLVLMLKEYEKPFAKREGYPSLSGGYRGLPSRVILENPEHFLGRPEPLYHHGEKTQILVCGTCGEPGCWPFLAKILVNTGTVTWSDFEQPHRLGSWTYDTFGPFEYDLPQYQEALHQVAVSMGG